MSGSDKNTRQKIIEAARTEFLTHGYEGARMHRIVDHIGVTKAMIHYYFNTKKELFEHVYSRSVDDIYGDLNQVFEADMPLLKKIESLIEHCLQKADENPRVLAFVITESNRKSDWLNPIIEEQVQLQLADFEKELNQAASNYEIASVQVEDLLLNIFSLCYYPVLATAVHGAITNGNAERSISQKRKGVILDTVFNWLTA